MGKIILFEDEQDMLKSFEILFKDFGISSQLVKCDNLKSYREEIKKEETKHNIRGLIIDLAQNDEEEKRGIFEIQADIKESFEIFRIPIFIHSANLSHYDDFNGYGTIFKNLKGRDSAKNICQKIKKLEDSGFLEIFPPDGIIEEKIMKELHNSFTKQFKDDEIIKIVDSIQQSAKDNYKDRVEEVFSRISIRALLNKLLSHSPESIILENSTVNAIEHYYRRGSSRNFWTGDIFKNNTENEYVIVLTPRCDIENNTSSEVLLCNIVEQTWVKKKEELKNFLTNNISSKKHRHLPKTPFFDGGKIDYSSAHTMVKEIFQDKFHYLVTLSDDLTNEVIARYCSYMLRTGIEEINVDEAMKYLGN
ncbi:MAG: hypothetical protein KGZ42_01680 [Melioribacter sp.]|nr:hypothetical protein [Melioribacter sp.]